MIVYILNDSWLVRIFHLIMLIVIIFFVILQKLNEVKIIFQLRMCMIISTEELLRENKLLKELPLIMRDIQIGSYCAKLINFHILPGHSMGMHIEHIHHFIEIHIPLTGEAEISWRGKVESFVPGQFTISPPGELHWWKVIKTRFNAHIIWLDINSVQNAADDCHLLLGQLLSPQKRVFELGANYYIYYERLINELSERKYGYQYCVRSIIEAMIVEFARYVSPENKICSEAPITQALDDQIVLYINRFLEDNYSRDINLKEIADIFNLSSRHISRHYKNITGITIFNKLQEVRLVKAEELLRETNLQVKAVAIKCGYSHLSHFASEFKKRFGENPSEYRIRIFGEANSSGQGTQFWFDINQR